MKTLIITDVQNDFMPSGALPVPDGDAIVPVINEVMGDFDCVIATQDWHPGRHKSFASSHKGLKPFDVITLGGYKQTLWPDHCIQGTYGAAFHPQLNQSRIETIIRKGLDINVDSYSGFFDNHRRRKTGLTGYLRDRNASILYFCGLAADFCVYHTIQDALSEGFDCVLIEEATRPIDTHNFAKLKQSLAQQDVRII